MSQQKVVPEVVPVPHQCRYGHKWEVLLPYGGSSYPNPSRRFCLACLEWGRIEVGSMQLETTEAFGGRIEYECPKCAQLTRIQLIPDFIGYLFLDEPLKDMFEKRPRWYHLPEHWPTVCEHDLRR